MNQESPGFSRGECQINQINQWFDAAFTRTESAKRLCQAFLSRDADNVERELNALLRRSISVLDAKAREEQKESFYHGFLLGLLRSREDWLVLSNTESGEGFCDIAIEPDDSDEGYVIELKRAASFQGLAKACEAAIAQIKDKRYDESLRNNGRTRIGAYALAFHRKSCKVVFEEL